MNGFIRRSQVENHITTAHAYKFLSNWIVELSSFKEYMDREGHSAAEFLLKKAIGAGADIYRCLLRSRELFMPTVTVETKTNEYTYNVGQHKHCSPIPPAAVYSIVCFAHDCVEIEGVKKPEGIDAIVEEMLSEIAKTEGYERVHELLMICPKLKTRVKLPEKPVQPQQPGTFDELLAQIRYRYDEQKHQFDILVADSSMLQGSYKSLKSERDKLKSENEKLRLENQKHVIKCQQQNETICIERGKGSQVKTHKTSAKEVVDAIKEMNKLDAMTKEEWKQLLSKITGLSPTSFQNYIR